MNRDAAKRIEMLNYALGGVATLVAVFVFTQPQVLGVLVGALLGALNFSAVKRIVEIQFQAQKTGNGAYKTALILPQMLVLGAAMAAAVFLLEVSVPFLALGFSIFMLSIAVETLRFLTNPSKGAN